MSINDNNNISNSQEKPVNTQDIQKNQIDKIFQETIHEEISSNVDQLVIYEKYIKWDDKLLWEIHDKVTKNADLKIKNKEQETKDKEAYESEVIDHINTWKDKLFLSSKIKPYMEKILKDFQIARNNNLLQVRKFFNELSHDDEKNILRVRDQLSLGELEESSKNPKKMKEVYTKKWLDATILKPKQIENIYEKIKNFGINPDNISEDQQEELAIAMEHFNRTGRLNEDMLIFMLRSIDMSSINEKENMIGLIRFFLPAITYSSLKNLLPLDILDELKKDTFRQLYNHEPADDSVEYRKFLEMLEEDNSLISTEKLSNEHLLGFLWEKDSRTREDVINRITEKVLEEQEGQSQFKTKDDIKNFFGRENWHSSWNKVTTGTLSDIDSWRYMKFTLADGTEKMCKLSFEEREWKWWVLIEEIQKGKDGQYLYWNTTDTRTHFLSYDDFVKMITNRLADDWVVTCDIIDELPSPKEYTDFDDLETLNTLAGLKASIDSLDPEGASKGFSEWLMFSVIALKWPEFVKIKTINTNDRTITLERSDSTSIVLSWKEFVTMLRDENMNIRRIGNIENPHDFANNLSYASGSQFTGNTLTPIEGISFNGSSLTMESSDEEGRKKDVELWGFVNKDGNSFAELNISWDSIELTVTEFKTLAEHEKDVDPLVREWKKVSKYDPKKAKTEIKKNQLKSQGLKKKGFAKKYPISSMTYTSLMQILQDGNFTKPLPKPEGKELSPEKQYSQNLMDESSAENMANRGHVGGPGMTIGGLMIMGEKWLEYQKKKWEHKTEVKTAYAFVKLWSLVGHAGVDAMSSLINGTMADMKKKFRGKDMRKQVAKILEQSNPYAHEILSAALLTLEMAWHLYPDNELGSLQWKKYIWFEKICQSIGLNPRTQFRLCYDKVAEPDTAHHPSEELLIERLFKMNQSNPYVQAIGGGAMFWKGAVAGRRSQTEKWAAEVVEFSTPKARSEYTLAKFASNEFEISLWAFPKIFDKSTSPENLAPAFVLSASNAPNYVHRETLDKFGNVLYSGVPFHGLYFCKNKQNWDLYKQVVRIAVNQIGDPQMRAEYQEIEKLRDKNIYAHDEDVYKKLATFWKKYHTKLHPVLQWVNPALQVALSSPDVSVPDKEAIQKYLWKMSWEAIFFASRSLLDFKEHTTLMGTFNPNSSFIFAEVQQNGMKLHSLKPILSSIALDSQTKAMSWGVREGILRPQVLGFLRYIRDNEFFNRPENKEYQKAQFKLTYMELMDKLIEKAFPMDPTIFQQRLASGWLSYFEMLKEFGIDISYESLSRKSSKEWFEYKGRRYKNFKDDGDVMFETFMATRWGRVLQTKNIQNIISSKVNDTFFSANDDNYKVAS